MTRIAGWIGRKGALYLLLVAGLLVWQVRPAICERVRLLIDEPARQEARAKGLTEAIAELDQAHGEANERLQDARKAAQGKSIAELERQLAAARREAADLKRERADNARRYMIRTGNPAFLVSDGKIALRQQVAEQTVAGLTQVLAAAQADWRWQRASLRQVAWSEYERARHECWASGERMREFDRQRPLGKVLPWLGGPSRDELEQANARACAENRRAVRALHALDAAKNTQAEAIASARSLAAWQQQEIASVTADLGQQADAARRAARGSLMGRAQAIWREQNLPALLWQAAGLFLLILASPYLIRALFYYVFVPLAGNGRRIRLSLPGGSETGASVIPLAAPSAISVAVRIGAEEELLVRSGFLQSSSVGGMKRSVFLLDRRRPLAMWATGLVGLTRVRGAGQVTTLSAVADPFAELTELALPAGTALVLHPRALVAVVQPLGRPLRITTHWRLFSLNAWLTGQLRYFAFHGAVRLVIRGGRGVRVERAEAGRIFGQDQLVGFSGDLAYSVTRNETFMPYFLGREPLLRDRVDSGDGLLIIEEAPLSLRGRATPRHGLEGALDGLLKALGM